MIDVCLILEGTFPYVVGGVSSWVYDLIQELPEIKFAVVHISPTPSTYRELKYPFPKNLVSFKETFLFDYRVEKRGAISLQKREAYQELGAAYRDVMQGKWESFESLLKWIEIRPGSALNLHDLVHSEPAWEFLIENYKGEKIQPSFIDYFWTWRLLHLPMIQMARTHLPEARIYHAVSTGYAGLLATIARARTGRPMILTEHGIYTRERKIEIFKAGWIYSDLPESLAITSTKDFFRDWWVRMFVWMSRLSYHHADRIVTLFERNRQLQLEEGAPESKTRVIPNGVVLSRLAKIPRAAEPQMPPRLYFVGRVVPIKDVKTLIKVVKDLKHDWPDIQLIIAGPVDEDETYYQECEQLVRALQVSENVRFPGRVDPSVAYQEADILLLTSISEGQPLVILEASACGIPVVSTDVGACRDLLEGSSSADKELGPSGIVTGVGDVQALANGVRTIVKDPALYRRMAWAGRQRVRQYYRQEVVMSQYQSLYESVQEAGSWRA